MHFQKNVKFIFTSILLLLLLTGCDMGGTLIEKGAMQLHNS